MSLINYDDTLDPENAIADEMLHMNAAPPLAGSGLGTTEGRGSYKPSTGLPTIIVAISNSVSVGWSTAASRCRLRIGR
ncbi:hypothetical protein [Fulvimarina sp. MAC8]|uniref:hypothetical protein n=1 Tax=Fulvimarina sp. MAC8 TaxID=3162874 RepID=UPI0032EC0D42